MGIKMKEKIAKLDKVSIGLIFGLILPILGFFGSYLVKHGALSFDEFVSLAVNPNADQQDILIFCLIPNMFMFYLSNFRWQINEFTKGLVGVTIVALLGLILMTAL
jgi:hypothetical protein